MFGPRENWERVLGVNLWGIINGAQVFAPGMIARQRLRLNRSFRGRRIALQEHPDRIVRDLDATRGQFVL